MIFAFIYIHYKNLLNFEISFYIFSFKVKLILIFYNQL